MRDSNATFAVIVLRETPSAERLMVLHRLLRLGLADIRHRVSADLPLVHVELFGNEHDEIARMLRTLLANLNDLDHVVHECHAGESPSSENEVTPEVLRSVLDAHDAAAARGRAVVLGMPE